MYWWPIFQLDYFANESKPNINPLKCKNTHRTHFIILCFCKIPLHSYPFFRYIVFIPHLLPPALVLTEDKLISSFLSSWEPEFQIRTWEWMKDDQPRSWEGDQSLFFPMNLSAVLSHVTEFHNTYYYCKAFVFW